MSEQSTHKLPVPSTDDTNRSASPSPTQDMIKGAGTTPILPVPPDPGFGEDSGIDESVPVSRGNSPSPAIMAAPPPSGESSPFGQPFENSPFAVTFGDNPEPAKSAVPPPARPPPPGQEPHHPEPPTRPPPPTSFNADIFGNESEVGAKPNADMISMSQAMPFGNIPFAALDPQQQQYIIQQQLLLQQQQKALSSPQLQQKPAKKASAFEDLDLAMRSTMAKPNKPVGVQQQTGNTSPNVIPPGMIYIPPGCVPPAGYVTVPGMPSYGVVAGATGSTEGFLYCILFRSCICLFSFVNF